LLHFACGLVGFRVAGYSDRLYARKHS
jgi:hypothetical protein